MSPAQGDSLDSQGWTWGDLSWGVLLQHLLPPGSWWLWRNHRDSAGLVLGPTSKQGDGTQRLIIFLPERWVLCPKYHTTAVFSKTKYRQHQPFQNVKAFFSCCLQDINKNRLIKSKAAQLDRASRKKSLLYNISISMAVFMLRKICLQLLIKR